MINALKCTNATGLSFLEFHGGRTKGRDYVYYFLFCYRNDGTHFYSVKRSMGKSVGVGIEGCVYIQHTASKTAFKAQNRLCLRYFKIFFDYRIDVM